MDWVGAGAKYFVPFCSRIIMMLFQLRHRPPPPILCLFSCHNKKVQKDVYSKFCTIQTKEQWSEPGPNHLSMLELNQNELVVAPAPAPKTYPLASLVTKTKKFRI
jgi:hypothetical protein